MVTLKTKQNYLYNEQISFLTDDRDKVHLDKNICPQYNILLGDSAEYLTMSDICIRGAACTTTNRGNGTDVLVDTTYLELNPTYQNLDLKNLGWVTVQVKSTNTPREIMNFNYSDYSADSVDIYASVLTGAKNVLYSAGFDGTFVTWRLSDFHREGFSNQTWNVAFNTIYRRKIYGGQK